MKIVKQAFVAETLDGTALAGIDRETGQTFYAYSNVHEIDHFKDVYIWFHEELVNEFCKLHPHFVPRTLTLTVITG